MFKKLSYLASVSILSTTLMGSSVHALFENELLDEINRFVMQQRQTRDVGASADAPQEGPSESSFAYIASCLGTVLRPFASVTGHTLRMVGDQMRGEGYVGDLLTDASLSAASAVSYGGVSASRVVSDVSDRQELLQSIRSVAGNSLRWVGESMVGETPTLERTLRGFWLGRKFTNPEIPLTSTACALYLSPEIGGIEAVKESYRRLVVSWNSSSKTEHSIDEGKNLEYFLTGVLRAFVKRGKAIGQEDQFLEYMRALSIDPEALPVTRVITSETVIPDANERSQVTEASLKGRVTVERQRVFMRYVQDSYNREQLTHQVDEIRRTEFASASAALPAASTLLAIEGPPAGTTVEEVD
ncbi:MAG: hypothetical protein JSR85_00760 [Proteobacteria bacterium]|nr:hypothetical protein [Pseudomonadota bacterium]